MLVCLGRCAELVARSGALRGGGDSVTQTRLKIVPIAVAGLVIVCSVALLELHPAFQNRTAPPEPPFAEASSDGDFPDASEALQRRGFRIAATHYWQDSWNYNFWSGLRVSGLAQDFRLIRSLGFNTVITSVPWGYFQTDAKQLIYDERAFDKLRTFLDTAAEHRLYVALRVGTPELVPAGIEGSSFHVPFMMFRDRELAAYCDLYREVARRFARRANLLFIFGSWEDIGYLPPETAVPGQESPALPPTLVELMRRHPLEQWNRRWGTSYASFEEIQNPIHGSTAFADLLELADSYLMSEVLPRIAWTARSGHPSIRLGFEIRVDAEPIWTQGRDRDPEWFSHHRTWNLPGDFDIICAYFNPYWQAANMGGWISPGDAVKNLRGLLNLIEANTDGRPVFFDQFNFIDSTPAFSRNTQLRDEEAIAQFLEMAHPMLHRRSLGYAVWSLRAYETNMIYNAAFEDELREWAVLGGDPQQAVVFEDPDRLENAVRLEPGAAIRQRVDWGFAPGHRTSEVPFTLRVFSRGGEGSRLKVRYEYLAPAVDAGDDIKAGAADKGAIGDGWRHLALDFVLWPDSTWAKVEYQVPCAPVVRLAVESTGVAAVEVDDLALFNHVQTAAILDLDGMALGRRAEVIGRINRSWAGREGGLGDASITSWSGEALVRRGAVFADGWAGPMLTVPIYVPWVRARILVETYLPEEEIWRDGNTCEVRLDGHIVGRGTVGVGGGTMEIALPDATAPGPQVLQLLFGRALCLADDSPASIDKRDLSAVVAGIRIEGAARPEGCRWFGYLSELEAAGPLEVTVIVAGRAAAAERRVEVIGHVRGGPPARGLVGDDNTVVLHLPMPSGHRPARELFVEVLDDRMTVADVQVGPTSPRR